MGPASSPMHVSQVIVALAILPLPMIIMTALQRKDANRLLTATVPGIAITMLSGAMPLRIATLIEAAPIVIKIIVTDTSPTLMQSGTSRITMKQMIFLITKARLSEGIPPVGGMNMTVQLRLITS